MRILHVNSARAFGGGEKHLLDLVGTLAARNHEMHVALRPSSLLSQALVEHRNIHLLPLPLRNAVDVVSALQLARYMRRQRIELIHAHLARDYPLAALSARLSGNTPFVITRHLTFPLKPLHRLTLRDARKVICVSQGVARTMHKSGIISDESKIIVAPNGTAVNRKVVLSTLRRELNTEVRFIVGTSGELSAHKGHEDFLRAAALIARRRTDVLFMIAGDDASPAKQYRTRLENLICELKLEGRAQLLGWVNDVADFYAALDVFVSAAHREPFGLVIIEAMASGRPAVVATATDGAAEILEDNVTGIVVPVGNAERMAAAIDLLLEDDSLRDVLTRRARRVVKERYSLDRMADAVEAVYDEVGKR